MTIKFIDKSELIIGSATIPENVTFRFSDILKIGGGGSSPSWQDIVLSGNGSLTLTNAKANGLNYLKLFGDCEQDGTPTPTAPVDIVCNNGAIKARHRSGLPLGYQPYEYLTASGNQWLNTGIKLASTDITETVFKNTSTTGYGALYGVFAMGDSSAFYANGTYYGYDSANGKVDTGVSVDTEWHTLRHDFANGVITLDGNDTTYTPFEFDNAKYNYLFARYYNNSYGYGFKGSCKRYKVIRNGVVICDLIPVVQLSDNAVGMYDLVNDVFRDNIGSGDFTISNPINDLELYVDGTVETVTIKQAFVNDSDIVDRTGLNSSNGSAISNNSRCYVLFPCKAGVTYTAQTDTNDLIGGNFFEYNQPEATSTNFVKSLTVINDELVDGVYKSHVVCDNDGWAGWQCKSNKETAMANNWQITSDIATATAQPLLNVDDYKDEQNVTTGAVTRNVGIKVLDGTEGWASYQSGVCWAASSFIKDKVSGNYRSFSTHYGWTSADASRMQNNKFLLHGTERLCIKDDRFETVTGFRQFLADQYNAGTPVIIVYPLATPTTETVTGQTLHIQAGTNVVEITQASIDNLPLEVSYKGTIEQQGE